MPRYTVVVTRKWPAAIEARLQARYEVSLNDDDTPFDAGRMQDALRSADAVLPTVTDRLPAELIGIDGLRCRILGNFGVGVNHIDLMAASSRGITVTNTPDVLTDCTADLTMLLLLSAARRASEGERLLRSGAWSGWSPTQLLGTRVSGKTLGIVGFGRIGRAVATRAANGFGMSVQYCNPSTPSDVSIAARRCASLDELLATSDFVSLHCPGKPGNRHLIGAEQLAQMKSTALLINTARGDVVDTGALIDALRDRRIAGAGLDVYESEPSVDPRLVELPNVTLLPHLGSATRETRVAMGMRVLENLDAFFDGRVPRDRLV
ncbi:MAG: D-glycerate dehydrogenase [Methylotetracoccus sp.]